MALLETLTFSVGPAVAKAILQRWLKDSSIATSASDSLIDLLTKKTQDQIAQRRGQRQFEAIGERVAESLLPLFAEARLDEAGQEAVAQMVADVLNRAPLEPRLLAQNDLDPAALAAYLLNARLDATRDFSEAESALYERIISETASNIVDIAAQLPSFTERTLSEVLKRERELLSITEKILAEVQAIRQASEQANPVLAAARFEEEYVRAVVRRLDELQLFGVDVSTASKRHRLSVAYITLSVEQAASSALGKFIETKQPAFEQSAVPNDDTDPTETKVIVPVHQALAGARRLLVRGAPGSGKTTLLKWVAVNAALGKFGTEFSSDWNRSVPFFIQLRQFTGKTLPRPEEFPGLVAPAIADTMPKGWVHEQLKIGRAIVLVDGLDEISEAQRLEVRQWLADLAETNPSARFILSSRPYAVAEGWLQQDQFNDAELQPMTLPDIDAFVEHWHAAVREQLQEGEAIAELEGLATNLKEVVRKTHALRTLATNPLLCAMLCALHRDRHQQLPKDRIELYEAGCHMLLERLDFERKVELSDYPALTYRQKRTILEDFAYWMIQNGDSMVATTRVDERFVRKLQSMVGLSTLEVPAVRRLFVERSGLLREPVVGQLDFAHRTFQEFLAAQAAIDEGDLGVLVAHADKDQWREVIILAAGLARRQPDREELFQRLLDRGDQESEQRHQLHLLAVGCLETATELSPAIQERVQARLAALVPPKNMTEAKALASAGDLAVPYLVYNAKQRATVAAASIRTLALIGSETALAAIVSYNQDSRATVQQELDNLLSRVGLQEYVKRVLSHREMTMLDLSSTQVSDVTALAVLTNLTTLNLSSIQVSDVTALASLTNLTTLNLSSTEVSDVTALASLTNLTTLDLSSTQVSDVTALASLTNLTTLYLYDTQVSDVSPLARLRELRISR